MCGIAGVIGRRMPEVVQPMIDAIAHRGPDGDGIIDVGRATLGMRRLAIQDPSANGDQPMADESELVWIVYNGELYNPAPLRAELEAKGHRFRSTGDTEVVLRLYMEYGEAMLPRLRGIFAFAIADLRGGEGKERYVLARDALGVKPLLYAEAGKTLVFGSEIKSILASGLVERRVEPRAVRSLLLRGSVYQPLSMIKGVRMLPPAHVMVIEGRQRRLERYWTFGLDRVEGARALPYEEQVLLMRERLEQVVRDQLISDVPIAAFLSGGVDSATLVGMIASQIGDRVKTFSVGFGAELGQFDETGTAGRIAEHIGTNHTRVEVTGEQVRDAFDHIVEAMDQPSVDGLNTYLVSAPTAAVAKVAISGTGGDDLFMGYPWHAQMLADRPDGDAFLPRYAGLNAQFHNTFGDSDVGAILAPSLRSALTEAPVNAILETDELAEADPVDRMTVLTLRGYTNNQLLRDIDTMSMAHSLEVRVPYLDTDLIDLALSFPVAARIAKDVPDQPMTNSYADSGIKRVLIDAARPYLPEGFDKVPKRGFGIPLMRWGQGPLRDIALELFQANRAAKHGVIDRKAMGMINDAMVSGKLNGWRMWLIMGLQRWLEINKVSA